MPDTCDNNYYFILAFFFQGLKRRDYKFENEDHDFRILKVMLILPGGARRVSIDSEFSAYMLPQFITISLFEYVCLYVFYFLNASLQFCAFLFHGDVF